MVGGSSKKLGDDKESIIILLRTAGNKKKTSERKLNILWEGLTIVQIYQILNSFLSTKNFKSSKFYCSILISIMSHVSQGMEPFLLTLALSSKIKLQSITPHLPLTRLSTFTTSHADRFKHGTTESTGSKCHNLNCMKYINNFVARFVCSIPIP